MCTELNITTQALSDKYLGLPALVGVDRSDSFIHLLKRIIKRLEGWKEKFLSMGGKEILLKAVIQAIPVYAMSVFNTPKKLCKQMTDVMAGFWWGIQIFRAACTGWLGGRCVFRRRWWIRIS